jgi:hypothetical protein
VESTVVILAVITMNAILGTVQTVKAAASLDSLKQMSAPTAKVYRDGHLIQIPGRDVTVGDVVVLEAGDSSDNTHKRLTDKCSFYHIQHIRLPITGGELGAAVGKTSTVAAIAITNEQLCKPVLTAWNMLIESSDPPSFRTKD